MRAFLLGWLLGLPCGALLGGTWCISPQLGADEPAKRKHTDPGRRKAARGGSAAGLRAGIVCADCDQSGGQWSCGSCSAEDAPETPPPPHPPCRPRPQPSCPQPSCPQPSCSCPSPAAAGAAAAPPPAAAAMARPQTPQPAEPPATAAPATPRPAAQLPPETPSPAAESPEPAGAVPRRAVRSASAVGGAVLDPHRGGGGGAGGAGPLYVGKKYVKGKRHFEEAKRGVKVQGVKTGEKVHIKTTIGMAHTAHMEQFAECPPPLRHPFTGHKTVHGAVTIFTSPHGRKAQSESQRESWWCSPWSDRGCGFSHAYTKQPLRAYNFSGYVGSLEPHPVERLPHGAGGIPAAFDDWKTLVIGGPEDHPSVSMLTAFVNHPGSFVRERNLMVGQYHATVTRGDASSGCSRTLDHALLWPLYVKAWAEHNFAHFLGDVWHWVFQLVDLYGEKTKLGADGLPVIFFPANSTSRLSRFLRHMGFPQAATVLQEAAPKLTPAGQLGAGRTCVRQLIVDCPAPNVFRPYGSFQRHLSRHYGWSFTPRAADHPANPRMLMLLRRPGGSRVLRNPQQAADVAREAGWCVQAMRSDRARLPELIAAIQGADSLVAAHGAELAFMTFLRNASVVIEAVPELYADYDGYYVEQARAGGLTLLRWRLPPSSLKYWGRETPCNHHGQKLGPKVIEGPCTCLSPFKQPAFLQWSVWRHRGMAGFVLFPVSSWIEVVRLATESLPFPVPKAPCPEAAPEVLRVTGVRDIIGVEMVHNFTHGLRCGSQLLYPFRVSV